MYLFRRWPSWVRGKTRVCHWLESILGVRSRLEPVAFQARGLEFIAPSLHDNIAHEVVISGVYEPDLMELFEVTLGPRSVMIDVGCNIGFFSIDCAMNLCSLGRVIAIEASPRIVPFVEANIARSGLSNVDLVHCAAGSSSGGEVNFYEAPAERFGMGSRAPQFGSQPIQVPVRSLDDIALELGCGVPDLVKIDVEGYELQVLEGAQKLLTSSSPPLVVFEFLDWAEGRNADCRVGDAQRFLIRLGYRIWRLRDYLRRLPALDQVVETGGEDLVAVRADIVGARSVEPASQ